MRERRTSRNWPLAGLAGFSMLVIACADGGPLEPSEGPPAGVRLVTGSGQRAFATEQLPMALVFQVADAANRAIRGAHRLRISLEDATGSVSDTIVLTNPNGQGAVLWR